MKTGSKFTKIIALISVSSILFSMSGCDLIDGFYGGQAVAFAEDFAEMAQDDFLGALSEYSDEDIDFTQLTDEQEEIFLDAGSDISFEDISYTKVSGKNVTIELSMKFRNLNDSYTGSLVGTVDDLSDAVSGTKAKKVEIELKAQKKDGEWSFEDLNDLEDMVVEPYSQFCVLDDEGNPINITDAYLQYIYLENIWYDSNTANPSSSVSLSNQQAVIDVFYFTQPVTGDMTAVLYRNGNEEASIDVTLDEDVIAYCEFGRSVLGGAPQGGSYTVELYYGDVLIDTSDAMTIN